MIQKHIHKRYFLCLLKNPFRQWFISVIIRKHILELWRHISRYVLLRPRVVDALLWNRLCRIILIDKNQCNYVLVIFHSVSNYPNFSNKSKRLFLCKLCVPKSYFSSRLRTVQHYCTINEDGRLRGTDKLMVWKI